MGNRPYFYYVFMTVLRTTGEIDETLTNTSYAFRDTML